MQNNLEFKLVNNFKCKRCGCTTYDKLIYTGVKTLNEEDAIVEERYVCRNCDFPFNIAPYLNNVQENITMSSNELLNESVFIDEGTDARINNKSIKEFNHE